MNIFRRQWKFIVIVATT